MSGFFSTIHQFPVIQIIFTQTAKMNCKTVLVFALIGFFCVVEIKSQGSPMPTDTVEEVRPLVIKLFTDFNAMKTAGQFDFPKLLAEFQTIVPKVATFIKNNASPDVQAACKDLQAKVKEMKPPGKPDAAKVEAAIHILENIGKLVTQKAA